MSRTVDTDEQAALCEAVEDALRNVEDPDAGVNALTAGLVDDIDVDDDRRVTVEMSLGGFDGREADAVMKTVARAVRSVDGVANAQIQPVQAETVDETDRSLGVAGFDHVVAVASTKGGVGKSTVAVNLACSLAGRADVSIFDADIYGPNVPALLGVEGPIYSTEEGYPKPVQTDGMEVMSVGLMGDGQPLAWRGAMAHDALTELFEETAWANDDVLVIDMPPGTGDTVLTTLQEVPVDGVVFVTTPFHTSVADTKRSLQLFGENDVPVLGVVRNMQSFTCPSCGDEHAMFPDEDGAEDIDVPVVAELPFTPELQRTAAPGDVDPAVEQLGETVLERVEDVWTAEIPEDAVDLRDVHPDDRHEAVREAFEAVDEGEPFRLVSDRDPSPVRTFLADLADANPDALTPFEVERATPETWVLETVRP
ncbi:P-loop NTPase [Haloarculaceae archaeon H-GB2-1]|nr:P-loop NTPase [Haloarculaceae archaeon H-GB1-1]MEA5386890.1 P-loop NTPase [Haloarculaceae archaeon H-GB11]MEA5408369.1 P-loop NTPase [Haloarculaceae archaeon H-GB2-1]